MSAHVVPRRTYYAVFLALIVLTGVTVAAAFADLGPMNTFVALTIACVKATLVVLYFMHARYGDRLVWVMVAFGLLWLVLLVCGVLSDYDSRDWLPVPRL